MPNPANPAEEIAEAIGALLSPEMVAGGVGEVCKSLP